jgi:hypothetical protein
LVLRDTQQSSFKRLQVCGPVTSQLGPFVDAMIRPSRSAAQRKQNHLPDQFFTAEHRTRLEELMSRCRTARDGGSELSPEEQSELDALVDAEVRAAGRRAQAMADELSK